MSVNFLIVNHIKQLPLLEQKQDFFAKKIPFVSSLTDAKHFFVVINQNGTTLLRAYFQIHTLTYKNFNSLKISNLLKPIILCFLKIKTIKILFLGNVLKSYENEYEYNHELIAESEAQKYILEIINKICEENSVSASILKEYTPKKLNILDSNKYITYMDDILMDLNINPQWKSLEDYIKSLSRKYAARAKKIKKSISEIEIKELKKEELFKQQEIIHELFSQVFDNQSFGICKPSKTFFYDLKEIYQEEFKVIGFYFEGELIAFYSTFSKKDSLEIYYIGFDYRLNHVYNLYFNILFKGLEDAILFKKSVLNLGRTSLEAKASLGAKPTVKGSYIKVNPKLEWMINAFLCYFLKMENDLWKERNPFRETSNIVQEEVIV
jgi:hypothetical protein